MIEGSVSPWLTAIVINNGIALWSNPSNYFNQQLRRKNWGTVTRVVIWSSRSQLCKNHCLCDSGFQYRSPMSHLFFHLRWGSGEIPNFKESKSPFSTPASQSLIVLGNLSTAPGCSGTHCAICHDKFIQHPQRAASQAISVRKLSGLNTHWWQIVPLPSSLCVSHYSLFSLSGATSLSPLQQTEQIAVCFLRSRLFALITHSFCLLFSFL